MTLCHTKYYTTKYDEIRVAMYTVIETPEFKKKIDKILSYEQRLEFITYLSINPLIGDVIKGGQGLRKIRWSTGASKSGGMRVIYYNLLPDGYIFCLDVYTKQQKDNLTATEVKKLTGQKT